MTTDSVFIYFKIDRDMLDCENDSFPDSDLIF